MNENKLKRNKVICGDCGRTKYTSLIICRNCDSKRSGSKGQCDISRCSKSISHAYKFCYECLVEHRENARFVTQDSERTIKCSECGNMGRFGTFHSNNLNSGVYCSDTCKYKGEKPKKEVKKMEDPKLKWAPEETKDRSKTICGDCGGDKGGDLFRCQECYDKISTWTGCSRCAKVIAKKYQHCYECLQEEWAFPSGEIDRIVQCEICSKRDRFGHFFNLKCTDCRVINPSYMSGLNSNDGSLTLTSDDVISYGTSTPDSANITMNATDDNGDPVFITPTYVNWKDVEGYGSGSVVSDLSVKFEPTEEPKEEDDPFAKPVGFCQDCGTEIFKLDYNYTNFQIQGLCLECHGETKEEIQKEKQKEEQDVVRFVTCECIVTSNGDWVKDPSCDIHYEGTKENPVDCTCRYRGIAETTGRSIIWEKTLNSSCPIHTKTPEKQEKASEQRIRIISEQQESETMVAIEGTEKTEKTEEPFRNKTTEEHIGFFVIGLIKAGLLILLVGLAILFLPAIIGLGFEFIMAVGQLIIDQTIEFWSGRGDFPILVFGVLVVIFIVAVYNFGIDWTYFEKKEKEEGKGRYKEYKYL